MNDRFDRIAAFFGALCSIWGGIPALFFAFYLGFIFGGGDGDLSYLWIEVLRVLGRSGFTFVALPIYAICMIALLYSDAPRLPVLYLIFATSAVSAFFAWSDYDLTHRRFSFRLWLMVIPPLIYVLTLIWRRHLNR